MFLFLKGYVFGIYIYKYTYVHICMENISVLTAIISGEWNCVI